MVGAAATACLTGLSVLLLFVAIWRFLPQRDPMANRLDKLSPLPPVDENEPATPRLRGLIGKGGPGKHNPERALTLARAEIPLTPAEFSLLLNVSTVGAAVLALWQFGLLAAVGVALLLRMAAKFFIRFRIQRRQRRFTAQLPDVLTLLVGALRAGYGLNQAIGVLVEQMPAPTSDEMAQVLAAVNVGIPMQQALRDMAERVGSDDLDLVVTAISVQYEMGGNLAAVLETIGDTIRERIRILREVRVLTAQQRLTGYLLASLPFVLFVMISMLNRHFFDPFFEPGWVRLMPAAAITMMLAGFFAIGRIVNIEV
ncbi:MAG: type II secretion system F family protein [Caldilineaceae bacterium]|nr:type II secretion system F family protein [Caldilineaceae bacterium]